MAAVCPNLFFIQMTLIHVQLLILLLFFALITRTLIIKKRYRKDIRVLT